MMFIGIIVLVAILYLVFNPTRGHHGESSRDFREDPVEILKRRYAAGDISQEEFFRTKEALIGKGKEE